MVRVAIVGGGVNGITCALKIKEKCNNFDVVLISKDFSPNTTGDGSGGLWYPYLCGDTPGHLLTRWGGETYNFLYEKWPVSELKISLMPIYVLYKNGNMSHRPVWANDVFGYRELEEPQLNFLSRIDSAKYTSGHTFMTFIVHAPSFLSYLYQQYEKAGGTMVRADVSSLRDPILKGYDVVVNCTGIGARDIVPDSRVFPIRGQVARIIAPWINATIIDEDTGNYLIPNSEYCVIGGTHQEHDYNTDIDEKDTRFILNGCENIMPGLKNAAVIQHWAGLRPGRDQVRLELEMKNGTAYIHNYGHGGSGFTLFWGCANDVLEILEKYLIYSQRQNDKQSLSEKCKL